MTVDAFADQSNATAVRIEPGEDARALLPHLDRIALVEVNFPVYGDGRGYSAARILREEATPSAAHRAPGIAAGRSSESGRPDEKIATHRARGGRFSAVRRLALHPHEGILNPVSVDVTEQELPEVPLRAPAAQREPAAVPAPEAHPARRAA